MNSQQSIVLSVPRVVANNPIARAVERRRLQLYFTATSLEMLTHPDGKDASSLVQGIAEAIGIASKAVEGYDDPAGVRDQLDEAMGALLVISGDGFRWRAAAAPALVEALDSAIQILCSSDPAEKVKAWAWAQKVGIDAARAVERAAA